MYDLTQDYTPQTEALRAALIEAADEKLDRYGIGDGERCLSEVSAASYDGFIAHTNGGSRLMVPCTLRDVEGDGLTDFESDTLQGYIDRSHVDAAEAFIDARPDLKALWDDYDGPHDAADWVREYFDEREREYADRYHNSSAPELPGIESAPTWSADIEREELWEVTDHWLTEGATFWYEIRVLYFEDGHRHNTLGADQVYTMAGINTDFEYGRDRGLVTATERDYPLARLTPARIRAIVDAFADKL